MKKQTCAWLALGAGLMAMAAPRASAAATLQTLYSFTGGTNGVGAGAGVAFDRAGNLYGTTSTGGDLSCGSNNAGCGTFFELTPAASGPWGFTQISSFNGTSGNQPVGNMVTTTAGVLYAATYGGGGHGAGNILRLASATVPKVANLFNFRGAFTGANPLSGPISDGETLYGTAWLAGPHGHGAVYSFTPSATKGIGVFTVLHGFGGGTAGESPIGGLVRGASGELYGMTQYGGLASCNSSGLGCGLVYRLEPPVAPSTSWGFSVLYTFTGTTDGANPQGSMAIGPDGSLYGTAPNDGAGTYGTVFRLTPPAAGKHVWKFSTIYSFSASDGAGPLSALVFDQQGNLFGTTPYGGNGCGTVFGLSPASPSWTLTTSFKFDCSQSAVPTPYLTFDASYTSLYGMTTSGNGSVYRLTP